jgi:hypothetical protein
MPNDRQGPGVGALLWVGLKIKLGVVKSQESPPARLSWAARWKRFEPPEWSREVFAFAALVGIIGGLIKLALWAGPWVGAGAMGALCSLATCEEPKVSVVDARVFSSADRARLASLSVALPSSVEESLQAGAAVAGLVEREREAVLMTVERARVDVEKERLEKDERLINSFFAKAVLSGQSVDEAKARAAAALKKQEAEAAKTTKLLDLAWRWASDSPRIRAEWGLVRQAFAPWAQGAPAASVEGRLWALRQTRRTEATFFGVLWMCALALGLVIGVVLWLKMARVAKAWVEADRARLTRAWESGQLGSAAKLSGGDGAKPESRRL